MSRNPPLPYDPFSKPARARGARILAIQAIYQTSYSGAPYNETALQFHHDHMKRAQGRKIDKNLFDSILTLLQDHQSSIQETLDDCLQPKWHMARLEKVLQAILLAGAAEAHLRITPTAILINEYVQITQGFFQQDQDKLVHAVLDCVCKKIR